VNNGRAEGLNNHVRLIIRRAYGFHSAKAALALVMLSSGPIELLLPRKIARMIHIGAGRARCASVLRGRASVLARA